MIAVLQHRAGDCIQERYEVLGVLGSGAFGTVYQCRDAELDTTVAIKELHVLDDPNSSGDERTRALEQFRREAQHLSHLRHPNIVSGHYQPHNGTWLVCPVCGFTFKGVPACPTHNAKPVVIKQRNYLVMEYLDGPNFSEAAEDAGGVLPTKAALNYIRQIAEALKLIHARGWVHRDVKPENIRLRAKTDEAVLLDFGIATETGAAGDFTTRAQRHTTGGGTLGYAPDTVQERKHPDARSDIHALGMTLYRVLAGRDPLEFEDLLAMRKFPPRHFNSSISPALEDLIQRAIDPNPNNRPADGGAFVRELDELNRPPIVENFPAPIAAAPSPTKPQTLLEFACGQSPSTLRELVELSDQFPEEAQSFLFDGKIEGWLLDSNRGILARRAREIREKYSKRERALEAFLQATGEAAPPQLQADLSLIDFGIVNSGETRTIKLRLRNIGRGHLFGVLRASHHSLQVPTEFDGNDVAIPVSLNTRRMDRGVYSGELTVDTSAGELRVPFRAQVKKESDGALSSVLLWATIGMLSGFALRTLPFMGQTSAPGWDWITNAISYKSFPTSPLFGATLLACASPFLVDKFVRLKNCSTSFSLGLFATLICILCSFIGLDILTSGDFLIRPYMREISREWAAGGWMFIGGIFGAAYGTLRRWSDIFSPRLLQILLGWLVSMVVMYGLLAAATWLAPAH